MPRWLLIVGCTTILLTHNFRRSRCIISGICPERPIRAILVRWRREVIRWFQVVGRVTTRHDLVVSLLELLLLHRLLLYTVDQLSFQKWKLFHLVNILRHFQFLLFNSMPVLLLLLLKLPVFHLLDLFAPGTEWSFIMPRVINSLLLMLSWYACINWIVF